MDRSHTAILNSGISALLNVAILGAVPAGIYAFFARRRGVAWREIRQRLGLVVGERSFLRPAAAMSVVAAGSSAALALARWMSTTCYTSARRYAEWWSRNQAPSS